MQLILCPVKVQGDGAAEEIAQAIRDCNAYGDCDVLIVGRGGGSLEDLWAFNEEVVARAIYESKIPIISAVGHEVDWSIADFTADMRAATPSAAAEMVIPRKEDLKRSIEEATSRLKDALIAGIEDKENRLNQLRESYVFKQPLNIIQQYQQRVDDLVKGAQLRVGHIIERADSSVKNILGKLSTLGPYKVLERGYSIAVKLPGKGLIKDVKRLKSGDRVKTILKRGAFVSTIERIEQGDRHG